MGLAPTRLSFRDMVTGNIGAGQTDNFISDLDVDLREDDSIGYRALKNRIQSLWSPMGEVSLINFDNDYFSVHFALTEDYDKVLSGGPLMVYGRKVILIDFNTTEGHIGHSARLVVVVNLDEPLIPRIMIDGIYQVIEYEG
ncbi:hypothetical protein GQ457_17G013560 [Hibiscus cannabinus]